MEVGGNLKHYKRCLARLPGHRDHPGPTPERPCVELARASSLRVPYRVGVSRWRSQTNV